MTCCTVVFVIVRCIKAIEFINNVKNRILLPFFYEIIDQVGLIDCLCTIYVLLFMNLSKTDWITILFVWVIATILNINKPFHIDDSFHLEAAMLIAQEPLKPSSGFVNWSNVPEPISNSNHPPLFFYMIALIGTLTSFSEVPLHLLLSVFSLLTLYFFFKIAKLLKPTEARLFVLLFGLSPAFLVNQNLMIDIPILSASLAFGYFLLQAGKTGDFKYMIYSGIALGFAMLIKFTIIPLLVILLVSPIFYNKIRHMTAVIIPLLFISLWSVWNILEFNDIQLLTRGDDNSTLADIPEAILSFVVTLGAISPFGFLLVASVFKNPRKVVNYILGFYLLFGVFVAASWLDWITYDFSKEIIRYTFFAVGAFIILAYLYYNKNIYKDIVNVDFESFTKVFLFLWLSSISTFIIIFAPFIATRHVLLVIPVMLIAFPALPVNFPRVIKVTSLSATMIIGILLSISDYKYADFYKHEASVIASKWGSSNTVWAPGHWGWQWYAKQNGMKIYNTCISSVQKGDIFAFPAEVPKQEICPSLVLETIEKRYDNPGFLSFFSTRHEASFYSSDYKKPSWKLSSLPTDTIWVQRVVSIKEKEVNLYVQHQQQLEITNAWNALASNLQMPPMDTVSVQNVIAANRKEINSYVQYQPKLENDKSRNSLTTTLFTFY